MRFQVLALVVLAGCGRTELVRYSEFPPDAAMVFLDAGRPDAGTPDAGTPDAGPPDAGPCLPRPVPLTPAVPTVMFVVDRSGSMNEDLDGNMDGGTTRWQVLETSLRSVLPPLDQQIAMGVLMYPVAGSACLAPSGVDLSPATGNTARVLNLFSTSMPLGGTPTSDSVGVAADHLRQLRTATSARALILATDGAPNCNPALPRATCTCTSPPQTRPNCEEGTHCLDDQRTVTTLGTWFGAGIPTYVIGLGSQLNVFAGTLERMAVAGGVPRMGMPRYYSATSQAELTDAFQRITSQLTRCTFLLNGLGLNDTFVVDVGGTVVPEGPDGWEWLDRTNGELALRGMACDRAAMGARAQVLVDCH
jgi:hypothetical protein